MLETKDIKITLSNAERQVINTIVRVTKNSYWFYLKTDSCGLNYVEDLETYQKLTIREALKQLNNLITVTRLISIVELSPEEKGIYARLMHKLQLSNPFETTEPEAKSTAQQMLTLSQVCSYIGIPTNLVGHKYIVSAVEELKSFPLHQGVTKVLYPTVAKQWATTKDRVERNIRNAIEVASKNPLFLTRLRELIGIEPTFPKGKPTNSEFLSLLATYF